MTISGATYTPNMINGEPEKVPTLLFEKDDKSFMGLTIKRVEVVKAQPQPGSECIFITTAQKHDSTHAFTYEAIVAVTEAVIVYIEENKDFGLVDVFLWQKHGLVDLPCGRFPGVEERVGAILQKI